MHRLLDNDRATAKLPQRRVGGQSFPQNPESGEVLKVFVTVDREEELSTGFTIEQTPQIPKARKVALEKAAQLHFEVP